MFFRSPLYLAIAILFVCLLSTNEVMAAEVHTHTNTQVAVRVLDRGHIEVGQVRLRGKVELGESNAKNPVVPMMSSDGSEVIGFEVEMPRKGRVAIFVVRFSIDSVPHEAWFTSNGWIGVSERDSDKRSLHPDPPIAHPRGQESVPEHLLVPETHHLPDGTVVDVEPVVSE